MVTLKLWVITCYLVVVVLDSLLSRFVCICLVGARCGVLLVYSGCDFSLALI